MRETAATTMATKEGMFGVLSLHTTDDQEGERLVSMKDSFKRSPRYNMRNTGMPQKSQGRKLSPVKAPPKPRHSSVLTQRPSLSVHPSKQMRLESGDLSLRLKGSGSPQKEILLFSHEA